MYSFKREKNVLFFAPEGMEREGLGFKLIFIPMIKTLRAELQTFTGNFLF